MRLLFAFLVRLFPARFRRTFGADMRATFGERWREGGNCSFALRTIAGMFRSAALEHAAEFRKTSGAAARSGARKGDGMLRTLTQDLKYAVRMLFRNPGFSAAIVAVLALGIGANSAIFSLVDATLLRSLPFAHPDRLVQLWEYPPGYAHNSVAPLNFVDWSEQNRSFTSMAAVSGGSSTLITAAGPEKIPGQSVTAALFDVLGIKPLAGRTFTREDVAQRAKVVVLSERFWKTHFGSDPKLIGSAIRLNGQPVTVIGIVPASFQIYYRADLWTLYVPTRGPEQRRMHYLQVVGRLKPGVTLLQAHADMSLIAQNISRISPDTNKDWGVTIEPLRKVIVGEDLRTTSLVLAGVVGFVLLMACANVANLLLARASGRSREMAVRASLGGSRGRILRQLLTESALLAALGGAAGLLLAWIIVTSAPSILPPGLLPVSLQLVLDGRVVAFAVLLTLATGMLFGLAPAWLAARTSISDALRVNSRTSTASTSRLRSLLAMAEIAIALLLTTGAALLLRTFTSLNSLNPGYHASNVLTMYVVLPLSRYPAPEKTLTFYQGAEREIGALPGVKQVALGGNLPLDGWDIGQGFDIVGQPSPGEANQPSAHYQIVGSHYFDVFGIALRRGRAFTSQDNSSSTQVCIINEELARRYFKGSDPVGAQLRVEAMAPGGPQLVTRQIVGVIEQVKVEGLGEKENNLEIYVPITQNPWYSASIVVRTAGDPLSLVSAVKAAVARVDKDQPVSRVRTMEEVSAESIAQPRFRAQLVGAFAIVALILACVGVFGVLAFGVSQRTREFGVRMALGAGPPDVLRLVLMDGVRIVAAGVSLGLACALLLTRFVATLLFGVNPLDPFAFAMAAALLAFVALLACTAPALRATRVDPAVALRQE